MIVTTDPGDMLGEAIDWRSLLPIVKGQYDSVDEASKRIFCRNCVYIFCLNHRAKGRSQIIRCEGYSVAATTWIIQRSFDQNFHVGV